MLGLVLGLLALWLVVIAIGVAIKALLWLAFVGLVLFAGTGLWGLYLGAKNR